MNQWTSTPMPFRFWDKVLVGDGCWEWQATITKCGYGHFKHEGRLQRAHRVSWQLWNGPIPEGLWILHHCDNRRCVRPDHLFLGDNSANWHDAWNKDRMPLPHNGNAAKTHCVRGHLLTEENVYRQPSDPNRRCRTCKREQGTIWMREKRAKIRLAVKA